MCKQNDQSRAILSSAKEISLEVRSSVWNGLLGDPEAERNVTSKQR